MVATCLTTLGIQRLGRPKSQQPLAQLGLLDGQRGEQDEDFRPASRPARRRRRRRALALRRMQVQRLGDLLLDGQVRHHLARDLGEPAHAPLDEKKAVLVEPADVAGLVPAVLQHGGGLVGRP